MTMSRDPQKEKIENDLKAFAFFFKSIQRDGMGLSEWEASVVRTYCIWAVEGKPATKDQLPSQLLPAG